MGNSHKPKTTRTPIPKESMVRSLLQKEIGSRCPFCDSEDVGHFEIHHINEDPTDHHIDNLLLLCRQCHSKFNKKVWALEAAKSKKNELVKLGDGMSLESEPHDSFDYVAYSMEVSNGRIPQKEGNGSMANIKAIDPFNFKITLRQSDGRVWQGHLKLKTREFGELSFKYEGHNVFEAGRRECYISQITINGIRKDQLFLKPLTDLKDYGDEVLLRHIQIHE
jgi:hypothetical protein